MELFNNSIRALSDYLIILTNDTSSDNHIYLLEQIINKDSDDYKSNEHLKTMDPTT